MKNLFKSIVHRASCIVHQSKPLTLLLVMLMSMNVLGADVTFTLGTSSKDISSNTGATKSGVTVTLANGTGTALSWQTDHVRFYHKGSSFTVSSNTVTITQIVINAKSSYTSADLKYNNSSISANDGKTVYTLSGLSSNSVTITNEGSAQARLTSIVVTYSAAAADPVETLYLSEAGVSSDNLKGTYKVGDKYTLPSKTDATCGDKTFVGWSTETVDSPTEPTSNFYEPGAEVTLAANNIFYAVFADAEEGEATETKSQTLQYDTWSYSGSTTDKDTYRLFHSSSYIESAAFDLSKLSKVIVYGGTFGGGSYNSLTIGDGTNTWKSVTVSGSSQTGTNTYTDGTALSGTGKLRVTSNSGSASSNGVRISKVEIFTKEPSITYSDYVTSCVIPTYSVTIQSNNTTMGTVTVEPEITEDAYEARTEFVVEATAEKGYRFVNWTISDNNEGASLSEEATATENIFTTGAADVTLTANFEAIPADPITVTLNVGEHGTLDCEECEDNTITEKTAGEGVLVPNVTANEGWAFLGWNTSSTATEAEYKVADIFYPSVDNKTLYAVYAQVYKVTLKYTDEVLWQETVGGAITLPTDRNCKNETYKDHFAGWSTTEFAEETVNPTETPTIYAESITPTEDVILYPVFSVTAETTQWVKTTGDKVTEGVYAILCSSEKAFNGSTTSGHGGTTTDAFEFDANNIATSVPAGICEINMQPYKNAQGQVLGYKMYNADKGYLYAKDNSSGNLAWHDTETSDWYWNSNNWKYFDNSALLRSYSGTAFRTYGNNSGDEAVHFAKKETASVGKYWSKPANDVTNPELDLAAGDYLAPQTVKITEATYQSDYAYYYTIDGSAPSKSSAEYKHDAGIVLNAAAEAQKVQVIGYDKDGYASQIAAAEYTIWATYSTLAEMYGGFQKDKLVGLSMTDAYIHKVNTTSGQNPTTQLFLQEKNSTLGVVISIPQANVPEAITSEIEGKSITFTVTGKYALGNGRKQIGGATIADGFTISDNTVTRPTAEVKTVWDADLASTNLLGLIKLENVYVISENGTTIIVNTQADGQGTAYTIYDIFYAVGKVPESTLLCNVSGLFNVRDDVYSIMPVITEDFSLVTPTNATLPTLNIYGGSQEEPVKVGLNEVINITPADGFTAYYKVNDATDWTKITKQVEPITLTADAKLEVKSSRDYYTDATAAYYYEVDASLTKYAITIPSLSKTRGTVTVTLNAEEVASAKAGETLTITVSDITEHFHINSVSVVKSEDNKQTAAEVVSVSEGVYTFVMPECNVDIKVTYGEEKKYSIEYQKGKIQAEGEDITEVAQYEGTVLTLKECTWTSDNYIFKGWKAQYNDGEKDVELPITNNTITVPAYDVKIIAQWNKIASYDWVLVTDADQLTAGDYVVIASNAQGKVASSTISSSVMGEVAATFSAEKDYLNSVPTGAAVLTLGGTASAWTLSDKDGHKLGATAVKKVAWDSGTQTWTIAIDASHNATIQNTTDTYGRFLHNVDNTRFTTYTSATSGNMLLPQLYKAVEHTYVVKYNLNGGANKPVDSHADSDGKVTITTDVPTYTGHKFLGWNSVKEGTGQEYIGGQEYTIEDDITIYAQWQQVEKYTVTYIANGATGKVPTETDKYETAKFSVKGQGELEYTDYIFRGWSDGENIYQEGDEYTMPNHAVEFTAQWESLFDTHWALVINPKQLKDGDRVIIAAANSDKALGAESDNNQYRQEIDVKKSADKFYLSALQTAPTELTLGIVDGKFTFNDGDGYLYAAGNATSKQNWLNIEEELEEGIWNITIENGVASITSTVNEYVPVMSYNSSTPRFSCYTQIQGQGALAIYKYYEVRPDYIVETLPSTNIGTRCYTQGTAEEFAYAGVTFYEILNKDANAKNVTLQEVTAMEAGMPYIFQPNADNEELKMTIMVGGEEEATAQNHNGLYGWLSEEMTFDNQIDEKDAYFVNGGKIKKCGANCTILKNRAYIVMEDVPSENQVTPAPGRRRITLGVESTDTPTGFDYIFGKPAEAIQKLIINNQLIIIRHGHFYNAAGARMK